VALEQQLLGEKIAQGKRARVPGPLTLLFCVLILVAGLALLGISVHTHYSIPREEGLSLAEGIPTDVETVLVPRRGGGGRVLQFKVKSVLTAYSDDSPRYEEVAAAIGSGSPVRAWVWAERKATALRPGEVPLFKLECRGRTVLDYESVAAHKREENRALLIVGIAVTTVGAGGLFGYFYARRKYRLLTQAG
jgi:hypothetical protein